MGYWGDVWYDMQRGMSQEKAEKLNAELRFGNKTPEEKRRLEAEAEADLKLDSML